MPINKKLGWFETGMDRSCPYPNSYFLQSLFLMQKKLLKMSKTIIWHAGMYPENAKKTVGFLLRRRIIIRITSLGWAVPSSYSSLLACCVAAKSNSYISDLVFTTEDLKPILVFLCWFPAIKVVFHRIVESFTQIQLFK